MKKYIAIFIIFCFLSLPSSFDLNAQTDTFGGRLLGTFYCSCSNNLLLFIQDYKSGSLLRLFYGSGSNLLVGSPYGLYQLGSHGGSASCVLPVCSGSCCTVLTGQIIGYGSPGFGTSN